MTLKMWRPMYSHVNRGLYRAVERGLAEAYREGCKFGVEITLTYAVSDGRLPSSVTVKAGPNLTINGTGDYAFGKANTFNQMARQDAPVITRVPIDSELALLFQTAKQRVAGGWTVENSNHAGEFVGWQTQGALPAPELRRYAYLDYIYLELDEQPKLPMNSVGTIGKCRGFSDRQREIISLANRYSQSAGKIGECWSDAEDDPVKSALLDLGTDSGFEIDHIMPEKPVGSNLFSNAQVTSGSYNRSKGRG